MVVVQFAKANRKVKTLFDDHLDDLDTFFLFLQQQLRVKLQKGNALVIFDEVQRFPRAREAIKYLVADGRYHYLETGSLISINENVEKILIPSEERRIKMFPMDFMELACRKYGVKFGVYCSPWDRNNADYATAKYVETYHRQVLELNDGRYGEIFEMWFDGANGGDGYYGGAWERRSIGVAAEYYDFKSLLPKIRALQPDVCFFGGSPTSEFKWPGNESGVVSPESGATRDDGTFRVFEADFPLRPGWFYHASQDGFSRSGEFLMKIYLRTVGNGATMDIGIAPDRRGLLSDEDVGCLARFAEIRKAFFSRKADGSG